MPQAATVVRPPMHEHLSFEGGFDLGEVEPALLEPLSEWERELIEELILEELAGSAGQLREIP